MRLPIVWCCLFALGSTADAPPARAATASPPTFIQRACGPAGTYFRGQLLTVRATAIGNPDSTLIEYAATRAWRVLPPVPGDEVWSGDTLRYTLRVQVPDSASTGTFSLRLDLVDRGSGVPTVVDSCRFTWASAPTTGAIVLDCGPAPRFRPGQPIALDLTVSNRLTTGVLALWDVVPPPGWRARPASGFIELSPGTVRAPIVFTIDAPDSAARATRFARFTLEVIAGPDIEPGCVFQLEPDLAELAAYSGRIFARGNPTSAGLLVAFELHDIRPAVIEVLDAFGRLRRRRPVGPGQGVQQTELDPARELEPGIYLVRIVSPAGSRQTRVAIVR